MWLEITKGKREHLRLLFCGTFREKGKMWGNVVCLLSGLTITP